MRIDVQELNGRIHLMIAYPNETYISGGIPKDELSIRAIRRAVAPMDIALSHSQMEQIMSRVHHPSWEGGPARI